MTRDCHKALPETGSKPVIDPYGTCISYYAIKRCRPQTSSMGSILACA